MIRKAAFIGHSFMENDSEVVRKFLDFFNKVQDMDIGFSWDHAEPAEPKVLSEKVREKMRDKNVFIGICTERELAVDPRAIKSCILQKKTGEDAP